MRQLFTRNALAAGLAIGALAPRAGAQLRPRLSSAIDVGGALERDQLDTWHGATRFAPSIRLDQRWTQLSADAALLGSAQGLTLDRASFRGLYAPAAYGPFRFSAAANAERVAAAGFQPRSVITTEADLSIASANDGAWLGTAFERSPEVDSIPAVPLLRMGVWKRIGPVVLSLSSTSHSARLGGRASTLVREIVNDSSWNDTLKIYNHWSYWNQTGDSGKAALTKVWSELELGAGWTYGNVAVDAATGLRSAVDRYPRALWGRVSAAIQLTPRLALIASGGNAASRITLGMPASRTLSLGMRVSSISLLRAKRPTPIRAYASSFSIRSIGVNSYVVSIRVPNARTVELSGDFGHWAPVALEETRPDVWEVTLTVIPGTYRMNLRVDGDQWRAPPGTATVADEFNGTVGIVVLRPLK